MAIRTEVEQLDNQALEARTQELGRRLFQLARQEHEHLTELNRWTKQVLAWCLSDPKLKARVLRFLDVLPSLRTPGSIARHVHDYFPTGGLRLPGALRLGVRLARPGLLTAPAAAFVIHQLVEQVARQFIAGAGFADAMKLIQRLAAQGALVSLDVLGEQVTSESQADGFAMRYTTFIKELSQTCREVRLPPGCPTQGPLVHLSIKPSSLSPHFDPLGFEESLARALTRLLPMAKLAAELGAHLTLDMEQYELRDLTLALAKRLLAEPDVGEDLQLGIVIQTYLSDAESVVDDLLQWLARHHRRLAIRLVKGAYWDHEVAQAKQQGWTIPVYLEKWQTDACFERLTARLLAARSLVQLAIGSHNLRSIAHAMAVAEALELPKRELEFQLLYGMGEAIQGAIRQFGYPVRIYTPVGELIPGMAYLVRRILENTANESFLRQDLWSHAAPDELLKPPNPAPLPSIGSRGQSARHLSASERSSQDNARGQRGGVEFVGEPFANFALPSTRDRFVKALEDVRQDLGGEHPLLIGGKEVLSGRWLRSLNPAHPDQLIGRVAQAGAEEVEHAVRIAQDAQARWADTPVNERVALLHRTAQFVRDQRYTLAALEVLEVGKPWREADADVVEAIDYLEYYCRSMTDLALGRALPQRPGESNRYLYVPRGMCAVIAPWNFPLAILTGMASAALVTGNVVILKPAEQSPVLAWHLTRLFHQAGVPADVIHYLPGLGEEAGDALVRHPGIQLIMFTGSRAVGLAILKKAAEVTEGQRFVKHVVVEMGGKNAIIVDDDADLDAAIQGILTSAFSYSGQKCSAASRLIIHEAIYEPLVERLVGAVDGLIICDPIEPACDMGPLIDQDAFQRLTKAMARGTQWAKPLYRSPAERLPKEGYFVGPALFADVDPHSALAQEELFGPVLALFRVRSFSEALELANDTDYGLTGGVYSRSPSHIEHAIKAFEAGNLYLNRPITGALVARQPFGGYKLSGLGTKAGGPDYLLHLLIPKTICENTTRHGMPLE